MSRIPRVIQKTDNLRVVLTDINPIRIVIEEKKENALREASWVYVTSYADDRSLTEPEKAVLDLLVYGDRS